MMEASNENESVGSATFTHARGRLETAVKEKVGDTKYIELTSLSVAYWCDVPKGLWKEFQEDGVFLQQLHEHVNALTNRLVGEWAKHQVHWERIAAEADAKGDKAGVERAKLEFAKDCETLRKECETVAIEDIAGFFTEKAQTYANYRRYKFKAGAKLVFTVIGLAISIAALATAATPAAPATLVPAIIGLIASTASICKQVSDLSRSAEGIEAELRRGVESMKASYKDAKGKPKKKTFAAKDFTSGFASSLSGGASDLVFPSINGLMALTGTHRSKLDGLEVSLHDMGIAINALVTAMDSAKSVLEQNEERLKTAKDKEKAAKIAKVLKKSKDAFTAFYNEFERSFEDIPNMIKRIEEGAEKNKIFRETLERINEAVGSKNWAILGSLFGTIALTGIGFSSGAPSNFAEQVTIGLSPAWTAVDTLREYTPDMMEKVLG
ncbi:MAG TPA: hypothetical protein VE650_09640 [Acetobacteraceae bacterium]|nr:hypothetical protein [Acetobacteraceae bacterium]